MSGPGKLIRYWALVDLSLIIMFVLVLPLILVNWCTTPSSSSSLANPAGPTAQESHSYVLALKPGEDPRHIDATSTRVIGHKDWVHGIIRHHSLNQYIAIEARICRNSDYHELSLPFSGACSKPVLSNKRSSDLMNGFTYL